MSKATLELESESQDSAALVDVIETAPKTRGAPTPHEFAPTHEDSWEKWWIVSNILLTLV